MLVLATIWTLFLISHPIVAVAQLAEWTCFGVVYGQRVHGTVQRGPSGDLKYDNDAPGGRCGFGQDLNLSVKTVVLTSNTFGNKVSLYQAMRVSATRDELSLA